MPAGTLTGTIQVHHQEVCVSDGSIDVSEMFAVHDAMRKEYGSMPLLVKSIAEGDSDRAAVITEHVHLMGRLMHVHHQGEDELLWPLVQQQQVGLEPHLHHGQGKGRYGHAQYYDLTPGPFLQPPDGVQDLQQ